MTPLFEAAVAKYGWIGAGIVIGFAAKYGLLLKKGQRIRARHIFGDMLLVGMVWLIAYNAAMKIGLDNEASAMLASFITVGSDRVIRLLTEKWLRQLEAATLRSAAEEVALSDGQMRQALQKHDSAINLVREGVNAPTAARSAAKRATRTEGDDA